MKVRVTEEDIQNGKPAKVDSCPIALALKRCTSREVRVLHDEVRIGDDRYFLPKKAQKFIVAFDKTTTGLKKFLTISQNVMLVRPFEFEVGD